MNLWYQGTGGVLLERNLGPIRISLVYFVSGIIGFVLGGIFNTESIPSVGSSGALFGLLAIEFLLQLQNYKTTQKGKWELATTCGILVIAFVTGLTPVVDNFAHMGGFGTGLLLGFAILKKNVVGTDIEPKKSQFLVLRLVIVFIVVVIMIVAIFQFYNQGATCEWCKLLECVPSLFNCSQSGITSISF